MIKFFSDIRIYKYSKFILMSLVIHSQNNLNSDKKSQKNHSNRHSSDNETSVKCLHTSTENINDTIKKIVCARSGCSTKKLKLVDQHECRCGKIFCTAHRHSFDHDCEFDYKTHGKDLIKKNNVKVVCNKFKNGDKI